MAEDLSKQSQLMRALTLHQAQSKGVVRTAKERQKARGTHKLLREEQGILHDSKRKAASEWHSFSVEHRVRDLSIKQKKACL
jgi:hypothetical protein